MQKVGDEHLGVEPELMKLTPEPIAAVGPAIAEPLPSAADDMRSVIDKLHPDDEEGDDLGAFQGDNEVGDDEEETDEGQYDNSPADPNNVPAADADEYAHHENQPGAGQTSNGEKRQSNLPTATFESLMKEYKSFIGESEEEEMDEAEDSTPANPKAVSAMAKFLTTEIEGWEETANEPDASPDDVRYTMDVPTMKKHLQKLSSGSATEEDLVDALLSYDTEFREIIQESLQSANPKLYAYIEKLSAKFGWGKLEEGTCSTCHKDPCACDDEKVDESTADIIKLAGLK